MVDKRWSEQLHFAALPEEIGNEVFFNLKESSAGCFKLALISLKHSADDTS